MIPIGNIPSPFNFAELLGLARADLDDETLPRKIRGADNIFLTPSASFHAYVKQSLSSLDWFKPDQWEFEILVSREPVGVHNDRNQGNHVICQHGMIIPLSWDSHPPFTITYDKTYPIKVIYKKGILQTIDNQPVRIIDDERMMIDADDISRYFGDLPHWKSQLKGLRIHSAHAWRTDELIIFESDRLHSSSEFVNSPQSYKMSVNGLRYIDADT